MRYAKGFKLALATAGFSGVAVFLNSLTVKAVGDALVFTTVKNLGVALIIGLILSRQNINWQAVRNYRWRLVLIGIIGGSLPFYLFFKGLTLTNPAVGALIHKTLIFWVALWALPFLKEKISIKQLLALGLIFGSNFITGGLPVFKWGIGEWMILAATILWAAENIIAKVALKRLAVDVVVGARMILGSLILLLATVSSGKLELIFKLNTTQWLMTLASIGLLAGYVLTWYRALKQAPVTLVATVLTLATIITNVLSGIFITRSLNIELLYQTILLGAGSWFFMKEVGKNERTLALR
ncbi:MAG: DMT family transporter [Candidatus Beckwithbacteria bacterium]|nr:DMT family transporter [Candidatus Beckwithbacteria bacterium]